MTPEQALQNVTAAVRRTQMNLDEHIAVQQSLDVLKEAIKPQVKAETKDLNTSGKEPE